MEHKFTDDAAKKGAAFKTLKGLGYTYHGGEEWKPPLGEPPAYITWDGEGIPPAGAECEALEQSYRLDCGEWRFIEVLFSNSEYVLAVTPALSDKPRIFSVGDWIFRKYETPEERAASRKKKAVEELAFVMTGNRENWGNYLTLAELAYEAIEAGKIPGVPSIPAD